MRVINEMRVLRTSILFMAAASGCAAGDPVTAKNEAPMASARGAVSEEMIAAAKADAVQRTGKSEKEVTVVSAERVTWSDASVGCPAPGRMYAQVMTPGYRIVLKVGQDQLSYHAGSVGKPVLCPADRAQPPSESSPST
jgi:hypothetical protein